MANTVQAKKRVRQTILRTANNIRQRSAIRTAVKKLLKLIATDVTAAQTEFKNTSKLLDKAGRGNVIHPKRADRLKSRLNKRLKTAATA